MEKRKVCRAIFWGFIEDYASKKCRPSEVREKLGN
jgi:hypothetical protein